MSLSLPWKLVVLHSALIALFTLWKRWFITDIPFDSFYAPFFFTSGPLVYFVAHFLQLWSGHLFPADASVFLPWDVIPGVVCLILGGIQWWASVASGSGFARGGLVTLLHMARKRSNKALQPTATRCASTFCHD